jgi:selenocysteine lyase/cysteine desulfurase
VAADADEIALTRGASEGLYLSANGISLQPGDEVLTTNQEHSAGLTPWLVRAERSQIVVRQVEVPSPFESTSQVVQLLESAITRRTKVLSFCHVTRGGWLYPVRELSQLARRHGLVSVVDGAQAIGMFPIDLHELGCDVYAGSLHKWILAPSGTGVLYVSRAMQSNFHSLFVPGTRKPVEANRYEMIGTSDLPVRAAIGAAINLFERVSIRNIEGRNRLLSTYLRHQLSGLSQIQLVGSTSCAASSPGITLFEVKGQSALTLQATISHRFRINVDEHTQNGHNAIRVSTHFYNTRREIDKLTGALAEVIEKD